jgi:replicative DNA helicase
MSKNDISSIMGLVPPQDIKCEVAVLGALLLEPELYDVVAPLLPVPECFYKEQHSKIYKAILDTYKSGSKIDCLTVAEQVRKNGHLQGDLTQYFIFEVANKVTNTAHTQSYTLILAEKYKARVLIHLTQIIQKKAYNLEFDIFDILDEAEKGIKSISEGTQLGNVTSIGVEYTKMLQEIEDNIGKEGLTGITTGYSELNVITDGWQNSDLIILAARPSVGKTALGLNFVTNAANERVKTLLFSMEMSKKQLISRFAAIKSGAFLNAVKRRRVDELQKMRLIDQIKYFTDAGIFIDDRTKNINSVCSVCRQQKKKHPDLGMIVIDYLQLITVNKRSGGNREQEVAEISRELKSLAKELDVPVIALAQLNRDVEKTATKKPNLSHLRESGAIEQDADIIMFIWRLEEVNSKGETENKHTIVVAKNRNGSIGDIPLNFSGDLQKWEEISFTPQDINTDTTLPDFNKFEYKEPPEIPTKQNDFAAGFQPYNPRKGLSNKEMDSWLTDS